MDLIKVENESLARDPVSGAILETDKTKLNKYRLMKQSMSDKDKRMDELLERINKLEELIGQLAHGSHNAT